MSASFLTKSDYEEPCCPLTIPGAPTPIPLRRILEKLDDDLSRGDYDAAERHLAYWLAEADVCRDMRGKLSLLNERIGLYRKTGKREETLKSIGDALELAEESDIDGTVTMGTTLVNAATGYKAFGMAKDALPLYERAREIYESVLSGDDGRLGGLYNNMALALVDTGRFDEAEDLYRKALAIMEKAEGGELECAITYCNLCDLAAARHGTDGAEDEVTRYLETAERLLATESLPRDGYYAFVCEKCAPTFGFYGFFMTEIELNKRAGEIYERA